MKRKRILKKQLTEFIERVSFVEVSMIPHDDGMCYYSKEDEAFFTRVGMEKDMKWLLKRGITEQLQSASDGKTVSLGFNPTENKWYGWSHRAVYGFAIGSTCKKGDCHYTPAAVNELYDSVTTPDEDGCAWQEKENVTKMVNGIKIRVQMTSCGPKNIVEKCDKIINLEGKSLAIESVKDESFVVKCGRGEWTAKTMADAKQMAIDFAEEV